jgi:hypothetical protein
VDRRPITRTFGLAVAWLVCAVLIAFGTAGIVSAMEHQPGTDSRAELTWAADQRIEPGLDAAAGDLQTLSDDVDKLSSLGTIALAAVTGGDTATIQSSISSGQGLLTKIGTETDALKARLAGLPGVGPGAEGRLGSDQLQRYQTLNGALDATDGLADSWDRLTTGSLAAMQLEKTLADHDTATAAAARLGSGAHYPAAIQQLAQSDALIAAARAQRDRMAVAVDTTVLTQWIDANAEYDTALRSLYTALRTAHGKATKAVLAAYAAEKAARDRLPVDTRGLIIIMSDVARGGLNQAVISIEDAKGRLSDVLDSYPSPDASGSPTASPSSGP